jgi:Tol biopolymer transport system component
MTAAESATPPLAPSGTAAQTSLRIDVPDVRGAAFSPSFGDDGTAMFFHTRDETGTRLVEAAVGQDDELVGLSILSDDRAHNYHLRLAPDRRRVAFDSDREGERAVYIANRDGTGVRRVSGAGYAAVPSWSPDGSTLAFVRAEAGRPRVWNLWLADLQTGALRRLTDHPFGQTWGASWFPDGTRIAYSHETTVRLLDLGTGAVREFASPVRGRLLRTPAVSPDGRRVVFQVHGDGAWLLTVDDGAMRRILDDATAEEFTWHPSGGRFAYHSRRDGQWRIWITALPDAPAP